MKIEEAVIEAPPILNAGETAVVRVTLNTAVVAFADVEFYVVPPGEDEADVTGNLSDVSTTLTIAGLESYELEYEFDDGDGVYLFVLLDTNSGAAYQAATHCLKFAGDTSVIDGKVDGLIVDVATVDTKTDALFNVISSPVPDGGIALSAPAFVGKDETSILSILARGTTLSGYEIWILPPQGSALNITGLFNDVSSALPFGFSSQYNAIYTYRQEGLYTILVHNTANDAVYFLTTYCAPWTTRIDQPISDLNKQRADLQRVFGRVSQGR